MERIVTAKAKGKTKLDVVIERVENIEKVLLSIKPVIDQYRKRFGYSLSKNCKSCGALLGSGVRTPVKCPKCEKPTGYGGDGNGG